MGYKYVTAAVAHILADGGEGVIMRQRGSLYVNGKSQALIKIKVLASTSPFSLPSLPALSPLLPLSPFCPFCPLSPLSPFPYPLSPLSPLPPLSYYWFRLHKAMGKRLWWQLMKIIPFTCSCKYLERRGGGGEERRGRGEEGERRERR